MTFLEKLDKLMADRDLNKKTLSEKSGIAYTTIVNWYKRGYDNMTISIFKRLCDFFALLWIAWLGMMQRSNIITQARKIYISLQRKNIF